MTRLLRALLVIGLAASLLSAPADPAGAAMDSYTGVVTYVRDGDTIVVDINPPGNGPEDPAAARDTAGGNIGTVVRIYGVNTFSDEVGDEECWGPRATQFLTGPPIPGALQNTMDLVGRTVELRGSTAHAPDQYGRIPMRVFVGGVDLAKTILKAGLGLPMPSNELTDQQNNGYRQKAANARRAERRIWDDNACHGGPVQTAQLTLRVRFDADGDDDKNLAGEWVEVINTGSISVNLRNWELRDSMWNRHLFTADLILDPLERVRVLGGSGSLPASTELVKMRRWYNPEDPTNDEEMFLNRGDVVVLMDPDDDIRSFTEFPCAPSYQDCSDPLSASVALWAHYNPPGGPDTAVNEWVDIWNLGTTPIDLYDHYLRNEVHTYLFDTSTVIQPGDYLRVRIGKGTNTGNVRYWGKDDLILADGGDRVELLGMDGREVACYGWGTETCKKPSVSPQLEVIVVFDGEAPGVGASESAENGLPNGEWVRVRNTSTGAIDLSGHVLEIPTPATQTGQVRGDTRLFEMDTVIPSSAGRLLDPGEVVTFRMGSGTANSPANHYYLGFSLSPLFKDPGVDGGAVRLWKLDATGTTPRVRLAGAFFWPCSTSCTPADLAISGYDKTANWIEITNNGTATVKLADWWLRTSKHDHYYFADGATLAAGATVRIPSWNTTLDLLSTSSDWIQLKSPQSVEADCVVYGSPSGPCP